LASFCLQGYLNFASDERFGKPGIAATDNSRRKWCWVPKSIWKLSKEPYLGEPLYDEVLSSMSDEKLDGVLKRLYLNCGRKEKKNTLERHRMYTSPYVFLCFLYILNSASSLPTHNWEFFILRIQCSWPAQRAKFKPKIQSNVFLKTSGLWFSK